MDQILLRETPRRGLETVIDWCGRSRFVLHQVCVHVLNGVPSNSFIVYYIIVYISSLLHTRASKFWTWVRHWWHGSDGDNMNMPPNKHLQKQFRVDPTSSSVMFCVDCWLSLRYKSPQIAPSHLEAKLRGTTESTLGVRHRQADHSVLRLLQISQQHIESQLDRIRHERELWKEAGRDAGMQEACEATTWWIWISVGVCVCWNIWDSQLPNYIIKIIMGFCVLVPCLSIGNPLSLREERQQRLCRSCWSRAQSSATIYLSTWIWSNLTLYS